MEFCWVFAEVAAVVARSEAAISVFACEPMVVTMVAQARSGAFVPVPRVESWSATEPSRAPAPTAPLCRSAAEVGTTLRPVAAGPVAEIEKKSAPVVPDGVAPVE